MSVESVNAWWRMQSSTNRSPKIGSQKASASSASSLGSQREPSNQMAGNHAIGAFSGAPERATVDKLRDLPVDLKLTGRCAEDQPLAAWADGSVAQSGRSARNGVSLATGPFPFAEGNLLVENPLEGRARIALSLSSAAALRVTWQQTGRCHSPHDMSARTWPRRRLVRRRTACLAGSSRFALSAAGEGFAHNGLAGGSSPSSQPTGVPSL